MTLPIAVYPEFSPLSHFLVYVIPLFLLRTLKQYVVRQLNATFFVKKANAEGTEGRSKFIRGKWWVEFSV